MRQTKEQRQIAALKGQVGTLQRELDSTRAGRKGWLDEYEKERNIRYQLEAARDEAIARRANDAKQYESELARLRTVIESREAQIGRLCINKGIVS